MFNKKKLVIYFFVIIIIVQSVFLYKQKFNKDNNKFYQLDRLENGNALERIVASQYMENHNIIEAIPMLIKNINNFDYSTYKEQPKTPTTVSCMCVFALERLTGRKNGSTCPEEGLSKEEISMSVQKWDYWYKNEYPKWLDQNK